MKERKPLMDKMSRIHIRKGLMQQVHFRGIWRRYKVRVLKHTLYNMFFLLKTTQGMIHL
jgi:hypothetical protein